MGAPTMMSDIETLERAIEKQREVVIDLNIAVDLAREDIDGAIERLQTRVRERDRGTEHLARLIEWRDELAAVADTFGPEIAETFATHVAEAHRDGDLP
jgi:hypothetical protein